MPVSFEYLVVRFAVLPASYDLTKLDQARRRCLHLLRRVTEGLSCSTPSGRSFDPILIRSRGCLSNGYAIEPEEVA